MLNISYKITRTDRDPEAGDFYNITVRLNDICQKCNNLGFVKANDDPASYEYNDCECKQKHSPVIFLTGVYPHYQGPAVNGQECLETDMAEKIHDLIGEYTEDVSFQQDNSLPSPDAFEQQYFTEDVLAIKTGDKTLQQELVNITTQHRRCPRSIEKENCFSFIKCSPDTVTVRVEQIGIEQ